MFNVTQNKAVFWGLRYLTITLIVLGGAQHEARGTVGLYSFVDYLFWKPQEDGLQYATMNKDDIIVQVEKPDFCWSSGVRAGIGSNRYEGWDVKGVWTHLHTGSYAERSGNAEGSLMTITPLTTVNGQTIHTAASTATRLNFAYDTVDVDLGRGWRRCCGLVLSARLGAKWARINQAHDIFYAGVDSSGGQAKVSRRNNFSGAGPCITLQAEWPMEYGLSLCGEASGAFLSGKLCTGVASGLNTTAVVAYPTIVDKTCTTRFMSRLLLGLGWGRSLGECCDIYLRGGYEMQWWPQQWGACSSIAQAQIGLQQRGDLMLQGLVATFGLYF